ncbi:acyl-CoA N-acyltransferase [Plenodomus tracheiphilus IPT5]|uniref:Acyl-CoA N-acyltransferase n=1 Tax=Plenodomus tracheiphilus IPT5 TaxID=1408161 RepID=A0A6A7AT56_9PLEO|nr:acyl-CoA N-acyltransferase [Plenodomus tracheiphilus IPT5]
MHVRLAKPSEEPDIVGVCSRAFFDEDLCGRVMHPHRNLYPDDVQIYWHEWLREEWAVPRNRFLVAITTDDDSQEKIVGFGIWQRQGDDAGAQRVMGEWVDPGPWKPLVSTLNRALDPSKKSILQESERFTKHYWNGASAINWFLASCCVDPGFQGRGCGRLLVRWGLDLAEQEGVRASVMSSDGSDEFYLKCGFEEVVGNASEGEGNPLKAACVRGGNILFMWEKSGKEVKSGT